MEFVCMKKMWWWGGRIKKLMFQFILFVFGGQNNRSLCDLLARCIFTFVYICT